MFPTETATKERAQALTEVLRASQDLESVWIWYDGKPWGGRKPSWSGKIEYSRNGMKMEKTFKNEDLSALVGEMARFHGTDCDLMKR